MLTPSGDGGSAPVQHHPGGGSAGAATSSGELPTTAAHAQRAMKRENGHREGERDSPPTKRVAVPTRNNPTEGARHCAEGAQLLIEPGSVVQPPMRRWPRGPANARPETTYLGPKDPAHQGGPRLKGRWLLYTSGDALGQWPYALWRAGIPFDGYAWGVHRDYGFNLAARFAPMPVSEDHPSGGDPGVLAAIAEGAYVGALFCGDGDMRAWPEHAEAVRLGLVVHAMATQTVANARVTARQQSRWPDVNPP